MNLKESSLYSNISLYTNKSGGLSAPFVLPDNGFCFIVAFRLKLCNSKVFVHVDGVGQLLQSREHLLCARLTDFKSLPNAVAMKQSGAFINPFADIDYRDVLASGPIKGASVLIGDGLVLVLIVQGEFKDGGFIHLSHQVGLFFTPHCQPAQISAEPLTHLAVPFLDLLFSEFHIMYQPFYFCSVPLDNYSIANIRPLAYWQIAQT